MATNLFEGYTKLDQGLTLFTAFEGGAQYMINCYLVPAFILDETRFSREKCQYWQWGKDVQELNIYEKLMDFGISGSLTVIDNTNSLSYLLEQFISFELVINIVQKLHENAKPLRFEPYILNIVNVEPISDPGNPQKKLKIYFEDILTSYAKRSSIAALFKLNPDFKQIDSFPKAFEAVFEYLKAIVNGNSEDKLTFDKEIKFNNYEVETAEQPLIENIIERLPQDASVYDLLQEMSKDACIAIKPDSTITDNFEMIGDVMVPLFFREEYTDMQNVYYTAYKESADSLDKMGNAEAYISRPFALRNFYMPFQLAFSTKDCLISEAFTVSNTDIKLDFGTINGVNPSSFESMEAVTANTELTKRRWKNMSFLSANPSGTANRLIYFNWLYEYYCRVFLGAKSGDEARKVSNILPVFYISERLSETIQNDQELAERNSNVYLIENEKADPLKEILMQMGKSIASFVLLNNSYSFVTDGSLLRRPNEIVNLYLSSTDEATPLAPMRTDFAMSSNVMLYTTAVFHQFHNNTFKDKIVCNRIYEKTPTQ